MLSCREANPEHCCHLLAETGNKTCRVLGGLQSEERTDTQQTHELHVQRWAPSKQLDVTLQRRFNMSAKCSKRLFLF